MSNNNKSIVLDVQQDIINGHTAYVYQNKVECNGNRLTMVNPDEMVAFLLNAIEFITDEFVEDMSVVVQYPSGDDPDDLRFKIIKL